MDKKYGILIIGTAILFLCFVGDASAETWYVDDDGGSDFIGIQDAINAANDSDTIIVRDGMYTENIEVNKRLTIKSENGTVNCIIRAANKSDHIFEVTADSVNISRFTIEEASHSCGIRISDVNNCNISNNIVLGNFQGIYISLSNNNTIENNNANFNNDSGIYLNSGDNNTIAGNSATSNYHFGVSMWNSSSYNNISNSNVSLNGVCGIYLDSSGHNMIAGNSATHNWDSGICMWNSRSNNISDNNASSNNRGGILLDASDNNTITDNFANYNWVYGICMWNSSSNNISDNNASFNNIFGIYLKDSSDNNTIAGNSATHNWDSCGIWVESCDYNTITDNNACFNGASGIFLYLSDNNTVTDNFANHNDLVGGALFSSSNNNISNNNASSNNHSGIYLSASDNNTITDNSANYNCVSGISMRKSSHNDINNNNVSLNEYHGIFFDLSDNNTVTDNSATYNDDCGIGIWNSRINNITDNDASFNGHHGIYLDSCDRNTIANNNVSFSKYYGIFLWNLRHFNNIINNNVSNNNLFGILILNSTNQTISYNTANLNERGIELRQSGDIQLINNIASTNKISGFSLINSTNNIMLNNSASFNTYEGIYLSNSNSNNMSNNNVSSNYFGFSLYSSNDNDIINNVAESNYYFEVFLYSSEGNKIINNTPYIQEDIVRGVRLHVLEALTPSFQTVENTTNASYYIIVENLGNLLDTFDLSLSSADNPEISSLDKDRVFLGAGEISTNTTSVEVEGVVKTNVETIKLNVSDTEPGIYRAKVEAISRNDNTVKDVIETWTIVRGEVASVLINSPKITKSAIINSSINNAIINRSAIINSNISDSTITDSIINKSEVVGTSLSDVILEDVIVNNGNISSGNVTINGIRYEIHNETQISGLVIGSDYSDSNLVGIKYIKTLDVHEENSNVSFNISAKDDYFAGSMSVQRSMIPPNGIPEFTNNVSGYVYANASDNLANSTEWLIIKVFYEQNKLGDLNESSLRLRYFNETAGRWENISSEVNLIENYVWGNISHYSVFALIAQLAPEPSPSYVPGGGRRLPEEVTILIANPGINTFNFEWLCLDIIKVSIDLKSMTINAKVSLKKVDKPAEFPDPRGIVYGYFDISTNLEPENIHSTLINFRVHKSWTVINDVNVETIRLWRYANGWEELENAKIKEDDNYLYFFAETKGFSLFAITGEKRVVEVTPTAPTPTPPSESPIPSPPPAHPAPVSLTGWFIIVVAIVASAIIVSVSYLVLRRRKA